MYFTKVQGQFLKWKLEHEPTLAFFEDRITVAGRVSTGPGLSLLLAVLLLLLVHLLLPGLRGHVRAPLPLGRGLRRLHEAIPLGAVQTGLWHVFHWYVWNGQQRLLDLGCVGSRFLPQVGDEDVGHAASSIDSFKRVNWLFTVNGRSVKRTYESEGILFWLDVFHGSCFMADFEGTLKWEKMSSLTGQLQVHHLHTQSTHHALWQTKPPNPPSWIKKEKKATICGYLTMPASTKVQNSLNEI